MSLDPVDRRLVLVTQAGLPLVPEPYRVIAEQLGLEVEDVLRRLEAMQAEGVIRRIGAVPNHYALGYRANGMTVWDVADDQVDELGVRMGALPFVSHCYRRPRRLPDWPYNLFAMVHGHDRTQVEAYRAELRALLGAACRAEDVLYSSQILKKTGLRIGA